MQAVADTPPRRFERKPWRADRRAHLAVAVAVIGAVAACAIVFGGASAPFMTPDSASYIDWAPQRTPGYPLFLSLVRLFSPDYSLLPVAQYIILIGAVVMLCNAFSVLLRSYGAGLLLALAIFGNVFLMRYPASVMTDSLFLSFLLAFFAILLQQIRDPRVVSLAAAGLLLGVAAMVRPAGYAFIAALPVTIILWPTRRLARTGLLLVAAIAPILVACLGNYLVRGYFAAQLFGEGNMLESISILMPRSVPGLDRKSIAKQLRSARSGSRRYSID